MGFIVAFFIRMCHHTLYLGIPWALLKGHCWLRMTKADPWGDIPDSDAGDRPLEGVTALSRGNLQPHSARLVTLSPRQGDRWGNYSRPTEPGF